MYVLLLFFFKDKRRFHSEVNLEVKIRKNSALHASHHLLYFAITLNNLLFCFVNVYILQKKMQNSNRNIRKVSVLKHGNFPATQWLGG